MQAIFGNPLADAGVVGVSSGAALGAAASITFGLATFGMWTTPAFAFLGGLIAVFSVYFISRSGGPHRSRDPPAHGESRSMRSRAPGWPSSPFSAPHPLASRIVFWQLGSLNGALWSNIQLVAPLVLIGGGSRADRRPRPRPSSPSASATARHLGVNVGAVADRGHRHRGPPGVRGRWRSPASSASPGSSCRISCAC